MDKFYLKANLFRLPYSNFTNKDAYALTSFIGYSRVGENFIFKGFGNISFEEDDKETHWNPIVEVLDKFENNNTNCIIYQMRDNSLYKDKYKYCIIYQSLVKDNNYGVFWYDDETGKTNHQYIITYTIEDLLINITKTFNIILNKKKNIYNQ